MRGLIGCAMLVLVACGSAPEQEAPTRSGVETPHRGAPPGASDDGIAETEGAFGEALAAAREQRGRRTAANLRLARDAYAALAGAEGGSAEAAAGEAICCALLALYGAEPADESLPRARDAAERALAIDPQHGEALAARGLVHFLYEREDAAADRVFAAAVRADPTLGEAQHWWAMVARARLDAQTALQRVHAARELEPRSRILAVKWGTVLAEAGRVEEALAHLDTVLEADADFAVGHRARGTVLIRLGRFSGAAGAFEQAWLRAPGAASSAAGACFAWHRAGRPDRAREWGDRVDAEAPLQRAIVHATFGEWDAAFTQLQRAAERHDPGLVYLAVQPWFAGLRSDPRGKEWLDRLRLPSAGDG